MGIVLGEAGHFASLSAVSLRKQLWPEAQKSPARRPEQLAVMPLRPTVPTEATQCVLNMMAERKKRAIWVDRNLGPSRTASYPFDPATDALGGQL